MELPMLQDHFLIFSAQPFEVTFATLMEGVREGGREVRKWNEGLSRLLQLSSDPPGLDELFNGYGAR